MRPLAARPMASRATAYLLPGQLIATATPTAITTVLGSCISVCVWDPVARVGGMNHFLLPFSLAGEPEGPRYGDTAIPELLRKVIALGAKPSRLEGKVYGGAHVLAQLGSQFDLGTRNIELAVRSLEAAGIPLRDHAVAGTRGRKCVFHTDDGACLVKEL